jgi:hypothetical protein
MILSVFLGARMVSMAIEVVLDRAMKNSDKFSSLRIIKISTFATL